MSKHFTSRGRSMEVLRAISLEVLARELVVIVGPSGCGKTTLLRIIQGLELPSEGRIELSGRPLAGPAQDRGFVFQHDNLYPWRTVMRNVVFGLELKRVPRATAHERARAMIELVGLHGFEDSYPHELSGGMRQRVNLARALAIDPDMLLMDEPFAALDAITREAMQQELLRIVAQSRKTALFITHHIDEAVFLADRVAVMASKPGRIVATVDIELPRPRTIELKRTPGFQEYVDRIWRLIAIPSAVP